MLKKQTEDSESEVDNQWVPFENDNRKIITKKNDSN